MGHRQYTYPPRPTAGLLGRFGLIDLAFFAAALVIERLARLPVCTEAAASALVEAIGGYLDRDDQKFLELARDSSARALLTRDKLVLKLGKRPVIAARFAILTPEKLQIQLA